MLKMDALQRKHFEEAVSSFLRTCAKYLLNNLPVDNQIIKYARFFQPSLQQSIAGPNAISHLTLSIAQYWAQMKWGGISGWEEQLQNSTSVMLWRREYQTCKVEDKKEESHEKKRRLQYSYWKYAYGLLDIEQTTDKSSEQCTKIDD